MKTYEISGTYGSHYTPCIVYVYETYSGLKWYAVEDSVNVNATYDDIPCGVDVETLNDVDATTAGDPIESLQMLEEHVES